MTMFVTLMILILLGSISFCLLVIGRVFAYNRKYHLPESRYTRLFGFLSKEHIIFVYLLFVILNLLMGVWYIFKI